MRKIAFIMALAVAAAIISVPAAFAKSTYEINYGTWASPGEAAYEGMEQFKKTVEDGSNGDIKVFLYPGNQLGATDEQVEQVTMGTIQMMSSGQAGMTEIEYLSLPYLMKSIANWEKVINGPIGEQWNKTLVSERGIRMLGFLPRGPRVISCNKIINSMEDLKGLKIRSPERDYYVLRRGLYGSPDGSRRRTGKSRRDYICRRLLRCTEMYSHDLPYSKAGFRAHQRGFLPEFAKKLQDPRYESPIRIQGLCPGTSRQATGTDAQENGGQGRNDHETRHSTIYSGDQESKG
jgi:hypothetical protein